MLALVYLVIVFNLGDAICRRFFVFLSTPHRLAAAFLSGLLISTWFTYVVAWVFGSASQPMAWGNLIFFVAAIAAIVLLKRIPAKRAPNTEIDGESTEFKNWDWVVVGLCIALSCWMMFATFSMADGKLQISNHQSSDFGSTVSIMQSFANGHNFPTEYPHFSGERIRYHFLYYFQAGNLENLGLDPALSNNLLSILSMVSMLILVMTLGSMLFASRVVGRIGAALFFFHGSLSFIPFLIEKGSISAIVDTLLTSREFLTSGFPYRGETWGVWSQVVFLNQRHFASSIGIFLLVLIFVVSKYKSLPELQGAANAPSIPEEIPAEAPFEETNADVEDAPTDALTEEPAIESPVEENDDADDEDSATDALPEGYAEESDEPAAAKLEAPPSPPLPVPDLTWSKCLTTGIGSYIIMGVFLGLMPLWNGPVFLAAAVVFGILLVALPFRKSVLVMGIVAAIVALPQIIYLRTGNASTTIWYWGYTVDDPTILNVIKYLGFTFGFKWLLIAVAIYFCTRLQRTVFGAVSALIAIAFCFQFSSEVLANHKFLNIWLVVANVFAAFGIRQLWGLKFGATLLPSRISAAVLVILITTGGAIDLFPIQNDYRTEMKYYDDPLVEWVKRKTDPAAIFLSYRYVNHPILLAGRKLFYGHPYYAWSAGYDVTRRDSIYRRMLEGTDPVEVFSLLKENNISYVAIDNFIRNNDEVIKANNEGLFQAYCEVVFEGKGYDNLKIYKVPDVLGEPKAVLPVAPVGGPSETPVAAPAIDITPGSTMFTGGKGKENGQFDWPRGIAVDAKGNFVVADANNGRLQWFTAEGQFVSSLGSPGEGDGQFKAPSSVAFDTNGEFYVADFENHRIVKFKADRSIAGTLQGPDDKFASRDIVVGADHTVYAADEAGARIVKYDADGKIVGTLGARGSGDGQLAMITSVAVDDKGDRVFAADPLNSRIVVFDRKGTFIGNWPVPEWKETPNSWYTHDIIVDAKTGRLFASSTQTDEVFVFDLAGNRLAAIKPTQPNNLEGAASLVLVKNKLYVTNCSGSRITVIDLEKQDLPSAQPSK